VRDLFSAMPIGFAIFFVALLLLIIVGYVMMTTPLAPGSRVTQFVMQPGEQQVWIGGPAATWDVAGLRREIPKVLLPLAVLGAFVWFFVTGADTPVIALFPFAALAATRLLQIAVGARQRGKTTYALTTRRAIVAHGQKIESFPIERLRDAELVDNNDGTYTIGWGSAEEDLETELRQAVKQGRPPSSIALGKVAAARRKVQGFSRVADAFEVYEKIQFLTKGAPKPGTARLG